MIYNRTTMANPVTNIRLDPKLKEMVLKRAKEAGLTISDVAKFLFRAYAEGKLAIGITKVEYPPELVDMILQETDKMRQLEKSGKSKGYFSGKEMVDDILSE